MSHPNPSGDQAIAQDLYAFLKLSGNSCEVLAEASSRWFWLSPKKSAVLFIGMCGAIVRSLRFKPDLFFSYHMYYKAPDPIGLVVSWLFRRPYVLYEASLANKARKQWRTRIGFYLMKMSLARADHVFTNMREDYETLVRELPAAKVTHIAPAIDIETFHRSEFKVRLRAIGLNYVQRRFV